MAQFSIHDAKTQLSKLISAALEGDDIIIARGSVPVVRLVPLTPPATRQFGALKGKIALDERFNDPLPPDELDAWTP